MQNKKDYKKSSVGLRKGYYNSVVANVYNKQGDTIARIDIPEIEKLITSYLNNGKFTYSTKGRKYQYLTLN